MGKILAHLEKTKPDRVADFKANAKVAIKKVSSSLYMYIHTLVRNEQW